MRRSLRISILLVTLLVVACASSGKPTSEEREARLNREKKRGADLVAAGDYNGAIETLAPLAEEASGDAQVFVLLGTAYEGSGDDAAAIRCYEQSMRLDYSAPEAHLKLATLLMRQHKIGRAITEFEIAIEHDDRDAMAHYNYGVALRELGRSDETLVQWRRARSLDPENPLFAEALGIGLTEDDPDGAVAAFADAEALGAEGAAFDNNYGLALEKSGRLDEALRRFRSAAVEAPSSEMYRFNLAALLTRRGDYAAGEREWEGMLNAFGKRWSYLVYLSRCHLEQGHFDDAIAAIEDPASDLEAGRITRDDESIDRMPPGLDEALEILALAYRGRGNGEKALAYIRNSVALEPRNPSHLNNYGVILAENGMLDEAEAQWRKVLELDADNATAKANLSAIGR